ncbi:MAG: ABC transporter substrate-binding protein [Spirochaetales bacterium]|nr:ABC transporter substrate-binding protein [Spirochaetales bacterium]
MFNEKVHALERRVGAACGRSVGRRRHGAGGSRTRGKIWRGTHQGLFRPDEPGPGLPGLDHRRRDRPLLGDFLVYIDEGLRPDASRSLAESWSSSSDGLAWTFFLRKGVTFHNGEKLTSKDVKFTFDRLRDPQVGAATVALFSTIAEITTPDPYTVVFTLNRPDPDLVTNLGDYHTVITWSGTEDFQKQQIGTGAFIIDTYLPEDRMTLKRNPNYWRRDAEGNPLPYLDGIQYIFVAEASAQVEALRGGQVDYLIYLPSEYVQAPEGDPDLVVHQKPSNTHYVVRMRSDRKPFGDVRVRQAFRAAIDRQAILDGAFQGLGVTGRDSFIGPAYADYYLDIPELPRDLTKARRLLAEAGYASGLEVTLIAQQASPIPAMATILKEQLAEAGVTVEIQLVPSDVYYSADNLWLEADFAITDWGARATFQPYLDLAYTCEPKWNESHWCDPEVDRLARQAAMVSDRAERAAIYKKIQRIFIERGPLLVPFFNNSLWGAHKELRGIVPTSYLVTAVDLAQVYFEK